MFVLSGGRIGGDIVTACVRWCRSLEVRCCVAVRCPVLFWCRYKTKKPGQLALLRLRLKGRLPTLPLSQYHRRGEA